MQCQNQGLQDAEADDDKPNFTACAGFVAARTATSCEVVEGWASPSTNYYPAPRSFSTGGSTACSSSVQCDGFSGPPSGSVSSPRTPVPLHELGRWREQVEARRHELLWQERLKTREFLAHGADYRRNCDVSRRGSAASEAAIAVAASAEEAADDGMKEAASRAASSALAVAAEVRALSGLVR